MQFPFGCLQVALCLLSPMQFPFGCLQVALCLLSPMQFPFGCLQVALCLLSPMQFPFGCLQVALCLLSALQTLPVGVLLLALCLLPMPSCHAHVSRELHLSPGLQHSQCCVSVPQSNHTLVGVHTWQDGSDVLPRSATPIEIYILMIGVLCLAGAQSDAAHRGATTSCGTCLCGY